MDQYDGLSWKEFKEKKGDVKSLDEKETLEAFSSCSFFV